MSITASLIYINVIKQYYKINMKNSYTYHYENFLRINNSFGIHQSPHNYSDTATSDMYQSLLTESKRV